MLKLNIILYILYLYSQLLITIYSNIIAIPHDQIYIFTLWTLFILFLIYICHLDRINVSKKLDEKLNTIWCYTERVYVYFNLKYSSITLWFGKWLTRKEYILVEFHSNFPSDNKQDDTTIYAYIYYWY